MPTQPRCRETRRAQHHGFVGRGETAPTTECRNRRGVDRSVLPSARVATTDTIRPVSSHRRNKRNATVPGRWFRGWLSGLVRGLWFGRPWDSFHAAANRSIRIFGSAIVARVFDAGWPAAPRFAATRNQRTHARAKQTQAMVVPAHSLRSYHAVVTTNSTPLDTGDRKSVV